MYITKLILENYKFVIHVYNAKRLELDFSNRKSNICIIAGPNGSGKTFLLSSLTPFSNLGGIDVRDDSSPIERRLNGYKELELENGENHYVIRHYYSPHKESHTVKSFIEENGTELNTNGNVTSFKAILLEKFGLTQNFMKMLRFGSNVRGLINSKPTEKKEMVTEMLNTVDTLLDQMLTANKKISEYLKVTKQNVASIMARIDRLHVDSVSTLNAEIDLLNDHVTHATDELTTIRAREREIESVLEAIGDRETITEERREIIAKLSTIEKSMKRIPDGYDLNDVIDLEDRASLEITVSDTVIQREKGRLETIEAQLDDHCNEYEELSQTISKLEHVETEYTKMQELKNTLTVSCAKKEGMYEDFHPSLSSDEVRKIMNELANMQTRLSVVYSFGRHPMEKVVSLMKENEDVETYIQNQTIINHLSKEEHDHSSKIITELLDFIDVNPKLSCEKTDCPALQVYQRINQMRMTSPSKAEEDIEFLNYMRLIYHSIQEVTHQYHEIEGYLLKLPDVLIQHLKLSEILDRIKERVPIYDIEKMNQYLGYLTDYELFIENKKEIARLEEQMIATSTKSEYSYLKQRMETLSVKIDELIEIRRDSNEKIDTEEENKQEAIKNLEMAAIWKDAMLHQEEYQLKLSELDKKLDQAVALRTELIDVVTTRERYLETEIKGYQKRLYELNYAKTSYESLTKELEQQKEVYDNLCTIKKATSTKEGIPMYIIDTYLRRIRSLVNGFLSYAYPNEEIRLSEFVLTVDDFRLPFVVNNEYLVEDAMYASQGEQTFIGTAISIAISSVRKLYGGKTDDYNIYYFDEMDGPLDVDMSPRWIEFLENVFKTVGIEQAFVISHKNMFSSYLVDLVLTNSEVYDEHYLEEYYPLSNQIEIKKTSDL